jgi:hypothetical protein
LQYAAYHFQVEDIRAIVPDGQELLMLGRALARKLPSVARHEVMHGSVSTDLVEGPGYVIAFAQPDKATRESIDASLKKIRGYKGMRVIELGKTPGYDLVKGRIPKP